MCLLCHLSREPLDGEKSFDRLIRVLGLVQNLSWTYLGNLRRGQLTGMQSLVWGVRGTEFVS